MASGKDLKDVAVLHIGPPLFGEVHERLQQTVTLLNPEEAEKRSKDIQGIVSSPGFGNIDSDLLRRYPAVRVVSSHGVGYNHVDVEACTKRGVRVGYTPGVVSNATADIAWALLLNTARRIVEGHNNIHSAEWQFKNAFKMLGKEVSGSTLGIVGMGRIGTEVARRASGFSMKVLYHNRHRRAEGEEKAVRAEYVADLKDLLKRSDFVVCVLPGGSGTYRYFGREQFAAMRKNAIFVNVGRGTTVDHDALAETLAAGGLFGAGLDVTDPEPLPHGHRLLGMPNVVISPHLGSATVHTRTEMACLVVRNLIAGLKDQALEECVNPE